MIIKKIHIENFGKLHDFTLNLSDGLNEVLNENGFGKTTLSIFIKAMFYGMPPARESIKMERKKYFPWQGGNFGGYIEFEKNGQYYRATRFFSKTPEGDTFELLDLQTNKMIDLKGKELGEEIFGVGKETFEMTAFFPQLNFFVLSNNQMSANLLGLDKFKYDIANLNTAVSEIKKKITEIKRNKPKKEEITNLKQSLQEYDLEISRLSNNIVELNNQIGQAQLQLDEFEEKAREEKKRQESLIEMFSVRQKIENDLREKQTELNVLLNELNQLNGKETLSNLQKKDVSKGQSFLKIFTIVLSLLTILGVASIIVVGVLKLPVVFLIIACIVIVSFWGLWGILYFVEKKKVKNNIQIEGEEKKPNMSVKLEFLNKQIELLQENLKIYKDFEMPNSAKYENMSNSVYQARLNLQKMLHDKEIMAQRFEIVVEKTDCVKSEISEKEELYASTSKKIELLTHAKDYLMQANDNVSRRFIEPANKAIKEILTKFAIRNREFIVDTNFEIKELTSLGVKDQEYSSQGYQDILAFCVRLYFLNEIYKKEKPIIILDDTFVNLDDENLLRAKEILQQLKNNYQVVYMCCNSRCSMK